MTLKDALTNATEKAEKFRVARRKQDQRYNVYKEAEIAAKTASDLWLAAGTETNRAEKEWKEAQAELSKAFLEN